MPSIKKLLQAAAGNAGGESLYVEDVFSTYLYTPSISNSNIPINNGIDLDGEGGMVWFKKRTGGTQNHSLVDTVRGGTNLLTPNGDFAAYSADIVSSFNTDGFTTGTSSFVSIAPEDYASWTFRKAEKFFDVVTYTGNGSTQTINHNLGSAPGCIIVKSTSASGSNWFVYHRSLGVDAFLLLNLTNAALGYNGGFSNITSTSFGVADSNNVNGLTYVAYLFAHDAGGFGDDGDESIIKCGSYTGTGSVPGNFIDLGFEPQWVMVKSADQTRPWVMVNNMMGMPVDGEGPRLLANDSAGEVSNASFLAPRATGFEITKQNTYVNTSGENYIYVAIRRPMKTPESGTEVFNPFIYTGNNVGGRELGSLSGADSILAASRNTSDSIYPNLQSKLQGNSTRLVTSDNGSEYTSSSFCYSFGNIQDGVTVSGSDMNGSGKTYVAYEFKRATGFFDVVAYTGTGTPNNGYRDVDHNLAVQPEMMWLKRRDSSSEWSVNHKSYGAGYLNLTNSWDDYPVNGFTHNDAFTATTFSAKAQSEWNFNVSGSTYIAYLFATLDGVSKVGSYTGTGADLNVDCGFSAGARFILIKRSDSTGDWYYWDSVRGIAVGNDPYLLLNSTAVEVTGTDYIDPLSSGFTVTSSAPAALNASGGSYIFLAIA